MRVRLLLLSAALALLGSCARAPSVATRGPKIGLAASLPDALYLHKGGFAPAPPPGDIAIIYDTDSTVKTVDSNATKTALGGGGGGGNVAVRGVSTSNITLSGTQTVDGVALVVGDRELVAGQSTGSQNGVYVVASGSWARSSDSIASGMQVGITQGTLDAGTIFILTTQAPIIVGTTSLTFAQVSSTGFTDNMSLNEANSIGGSVLAWQSVISLCTNTAGNETACWNITHPLAGIDYTTNLMAVNASGRQQVTTTTATPTVTLGAYVDLLEIDVTTTTATTLTINGLGLQVDGRYEIWGNIVAPAAAVNISMNGTDATGSVGGFFFSFGGALSSVAQNTLLFADNTTANVYATATLRATAVGSPKIYQSEQMRENTEYEKYAGRTTVTADITSISFNGIKAGSTIYLQRGRAVNN